MNAEVISIGTELLLGEIVDTNAQYIANQLPLLGIDLRWVTIVGDSRKRLAETFHRAWRRSDIIITTGGLGPTEDDLTREAIAEMLGETPEVSPPLEKELRSFFTRLGWEMSPHNIKQATLIPSAQALLNPRGTAPGWWIDKGNKVIVAMPGPPKEMQYMWEREVMPRLRQKSANFILSRTLKCFGLGEAEVDEIISPLLPLKNADLGIYAKPDGIHLRLIASALTQAEAEAILDRGEASLRSVLADHIWGHGSDTLENVVGDLLVERNMTLTTMESFTGGLLAQMLNEIRGDSCFFKGGFIACLKETKIALGVDANLIDRFGEVSAEVAEAMAVASRRHMEADIGIGITGAAEENTTEGRPSGLAYIDIYSDAEHWTREWKFPPHHPEFKRYAVTAALIGLRQLLISMNKNNSEE